MERLLTLHRTALSGQLLALIRDYLAKMNTPGTRTLRLLSLLQSRRTGALPDPAATAHRQ